MRFIAVATGAVATITLPPGSTPWSVVFSPDGTKAYTANSGNDTVSVITLATGAVTTITLPPGSSPRSVAVSPDGTRLYTANQSNDTVSAIALSTGVVTTTALPAAAAAAAGGGCTGPYGVAFSPDGTKVYVANNGSDTVSVITVATGAVTTIALPAGSGPYAVAFSPDGTTAYTANNTGDSVSAITVATGAVATIALPAGSSPYSVAFSPDGTRAYTANFNSTVSAILTGMPPFHKPVKLAATGVNVVLPLGFAAVLLLAGIVIVVSLGCPNDREAGGSVATLATTDGTVPYVASTRHPAPEPVVRAAR